MKITAIENRSLPKHQLCNGRNTQSKLFVIIAKHQIIHRYVMTVNPYVSYKNNKDIYSPFVALICFIHFVLSVIFSGNQTVHT